MSNVGTDLPSSAQLDALQHYGKRDTAKGMSGGALIKPHNKLKGTRVAT